MRRSVRFVLGLTNSSTICRQTGLGLGSRRWGHARPRARPSALGLFPLIPRYRPRAAVSAPHRKTASEVIVEVMETPTLDDMILVCCRNWHNSFAFLALSAHVQ
jgi:hypothetical protein